MRRELSSGVDGWVWSKLVVAAVLVFSLAVCSVFAQLPTGTILGVVKDSSGATVPDAQVSATNTDTNEVRSTTTGTDGAFRVSALQPGHYNVRVEKNGFKTMTQTGITLDVAAQIAINASLEVGSSTQAVTVTGEAPLVNTTTSSLGGLVNDEKLADLPLNGRNFVDLALLQPGVTNDTNFTNTNAQGGNWGVMFSSNGSPVRSNNFTLDGAPMINIHGNASGGIGTTLGVDGIKEYRVITDAFSAEYGLQMGSQVVIVSKGGANQFHGDVFEYLRNSSLDARNFFDYSYVGTGKRLPELQRNNFGGSFGGPIKKNKTFFYTVYEALRQNFGATIVDNVFPANCYVVTANPCAITSANPTGAVASVVQPLLALFPTPNLPKNQFTYPETQPSTVNYGQIRVDHNFSSTDSIFGRYTIQDGSNQNANVYPQLHLQSLGRDQFITLAENHIFSPILLNTARVSLSRTNLAGNPIYPSILTGPQYTFVAGQVYPGVSIGGVTQWNTVGNTPFGLLQNVYTLSDDVYYTKGHHAFKFGGLFNRFENYDYITAKKFGSLSFASEAAFLAGIANSGSALAPGSDENREFRFYTVGFYAQDDWRVTSRLTLNLGLRYEFATVPQDRLGRNYAFRPDLAHATTTTQGPIFQNPSFKNFGPRVGLAWDVTGSGKTSIRAAFGEYYDVGNSGYVLYNAARGTPPLSSSIAYVPTGKAFTLPVVYGGALSTELATNQYMIKQPKMLQWNLSVERQLAPSLSLAVSYVGTRGIHLQGSEEGNPCIPTSITNGIPFWATNCGQGRLNPLFSDSNYSTTNFDSYFNSLQAVISKRLSHGLELQGAYTWGKVLDDTQGMFGASECVSQGGAEGVYPSDKKHFDKGPACFDVTHNVRINALYHLPNVGPDTTLARSLLRGWWLGSLAAWETGLPFTPVLTSWRSLSNHLTGFSGTSQTDHVSLGTATVAPGQKGPDGTVNTTQNTFIPYDPATVITGNPQQWFNPLMFTPGPVGFLGTATRDMLRGPHLANFDFSLNKDTAIPRLGENGKLVFRAEFFNIFNHANFGMPSGATFAGTVTDTSQYIENPTSNAGVISNTVTTSRQIQLSLKIVF